MATQPKNGLTPEAQEQLAQLAQNLAHNPKTRKQFVGLVKEIDPTKRFPDVEADDLREDMKKEFEKRDQAAAAKHALEEQEAQKNGLRSRYDDKAIEEIEKIMEKYGISDYEAGAKIYAADLKPAQPTYEENDHRWKMPGIEQKDFPNLKQISRQRANQAIDDIVRNRKK